MSMDVDSVGLQWVEKALRAHEEKCRDVKNSGTSAGWRRCAGSLLRFMVVLRFHQFVRCGAGVGDGSGAGADNKIQGSICMDMDKHTLPVRLWNYYTLFAMSVADRARVVSALCDRSIPETKMSSNSAFPSVPSKCHVSADNKEGMTTFFDAMWKSHDLESMMEEHTVSQTFLSVFRACLTRISIVEAKDSHVLPSKHLARPLLLSLFHDITEALGRPVLASARMEEAIPALLKLGELGDSGAVFKPNAFSKAEVEKHMGSFRWSLEGDYDHEVDMLMSTSPECLLFLPFPLQWVKRGPIIGSAVQFLSHEVRMAFQHSAQGGWDSWQQLISTDQWLILFDLALRAAQSLTSQPPDRRVHLWKSPAHMLALSLASGASVPVQVVVTRGTVALWIARP